MLPPLFLPLNAVVGVTKDHPTLMSAANVYYPGCTSHGCGECAICLQLLDTLANAMPDGDSRIERIDPCNHQFHRRCIVGYVERGGRICPMCRHPIAPTLLESLGGPPADDGRNMDDEASRPRFYTFPGEEPEYWGMG
jgi:hypothetical protein